MLPSWVGRPGRPFRDDRRVAEGIIYRYRCRLPWRDGPPAFDPRKRCGGVTAATAVTEPGIVCWRSCWPRRTTRRWRIGRLRWTPRSTVFTNTPRTCRVTQRDLSNYTNPQAEPPDHAIGRSRGGLSTKNHALTDEKCRPLVVLIDPGHGDDAPMFPLLMGQLRVAQTGPVRART